MQDARRFTVVSSSENSVQSDLRHEATSPYKFMGSTHKNIELKNWWHHSIGMTNCSTSIYMTNCSIAGNKNVFAVCYYMYTVCLSTIFNYLNMRHPVWIINFFYFIENPKHLINLKHIAGRVCAIILSVPYVRWNI